MKKLYNVIFPIWLILIVPPIALVTIPSNFIIDSIVLIFGFKVLKITNFFSKYKKSILKVWIFGFIVDIFGSLLLFATQFMGDNEYLYENLVYPLVWNPFESLIAILYILVVVIICGILIYLINYKFSFKKTNLDNKSKKVISLLLGIITAPYLFFLTTSYFIIPVIFILNIALTYRVLRLIQKHTKNKYNVELDINMYYIIFFNILYLVHFIDTYTNRVIHAHNYYNFRTLSGSTFIFFLIIMAMLLDSIKFLIRM